MIISHFFTDLFRFQSRRAELSELKAETGVLARTLDILRARAGAVAQSLAQQERDRGVAGYTQTQEELERVKKYLNLIMYKSIFLWQIMIFYDF